MSKYRELQEALRNAYPIYNPKIVDKVMKRIEKIRDTERQKQSSQYVDSESKLRLYPGDYVRWVISYAVYTADNLGNAWPHQPVYCYGLIVETANDDSPTIVVYIPRSCEYHILDTTKYQFEVLSSAGPKEST